MTVMLALAFAAALASAPMTEAAPVQQASPATVRTPGADAPTDLEDIVVEGRRLEEATHAFVDEVGQPARGRGLARWRDGVCIGVVNLRGETAQYIVDRVSTVAQDLGLKPGAPGCAPSVLIIATVDSNAFTEAFVSRRPRLFVVGGSGMDLGRNALRRFETTERPVRWWNVSAPVDGDTGDIAVRLPGQDAPIIATRQPSRFSTQIVDDTKRVFVIVDIDKINGVTLAQLGDYLAMVTLAQVNPDADTSGYATVLNLFNDPERTEGLTNWDLAYLRGLYDAQRTRLNLHANSSEIASTIIRVHHRMAAEADKAEELPPPPSVQ